MRVTFLPAYKLAMFDGEEGGEGGSGGEGGNEGGNAGAGGNQGGNNDGGGNSNNGGNGGGSNSGGSNNGSNNGNSGGERNNGTVRNERGRYESASDYEKRISELNQENQTRRQENRELRGTVSVLERRTIYADAESALQKAGIISPRATELFLSDMGLGNKDSKLRIDGKTGKTLGLENLDAWKQANPELFKPENSGGEGGEGGTGNGGNNNGGAGEGNGAGAGAGNGNGNAGGNNGGNGNQGGAQGGQRRNSTASGASPAGGTNGEGGNTGGLPDLRGLDSKGRAAAMKAYKASLR